MTRLEIGERIQILIENNELSCTHRVCEGRWGAVLIPLLELSDYSPQPTKVFPQEVVSIVGRRYEVMPPIFRAGMWELAERSNGKR